MQVRETTPHRQASEGSAEFPWIVVQVSEFRSALLLEVLVRSTEPCRACCIRRSSWTECGRRSTKAVSKARLCQEECSEHRLTGRGRPSLRDTRWLCLKDVASSGNFAVLQDLHGHPSFSVRRVRSSQEVLTPLSLFAVTIPRHRCSEADKAWDRLVSAGRVLTIWGFGLPARIAPTFICGCKKRVGLDVHDIPLANGTSDVFGHEVSPAQLYCSGTGKRIARIRCSARTISTRRRVSVRAKELNGHESWRSANSILDASFKFFLGAMVNRAQGTQSIWGGFYDSSAVIGACAALRSASVRMRRKMGSRSRSLKDVVSQPRRSVSERTRFRRSSRSIRARSRAFRSIAPGVDSESSGSDENEGSLARRECRTVLDASLQLLWIPLHGDSQRTVAFFARKTS